MCMTLVIATGGGPAQAALGGDAASVAADRQALGGTLTGEPAEAYTVKRIDTPAGLVVREYISAAGQVFAVTWRGPRLPDLRLLLGRYFDSYRQAARQARAAHGRRGMLAIRRPDLVVQSGGHMRSFFGRAYAPALVPSGVDAGALH